MSNLLVLPRQLAMASGAFAPNTLYFYEPGTSTPKAVYDVDGDSLGTSVAADANGRYPAIYGDGLYKVVEQTSTGVTVWTADNVAGFETGSGNGSLRADLASTTSGKGASLVGLAQNGTVQQALPWKTPKTQGATGDDVADDTAEVAACFDTETAIFGGTYLVSDVATVTDRVDIFGFGGTVHQSTQNRIVLVEPTSDGEQSGSAWSAIIGVGATQAEYGGAGTGNNHGCFAFGGVTQPLLAFTHGSVDIAGTIGYGPNTLTRRGSKGGVMLGNRYQFTTMGLESFSTMNAIVGNTMLGDSAPSHCYRVTGYDFSPATGVVAAANVGESANTLYSLQKTATHCHLGSSHGSNITEAIQFVEDYSADTDVQRHNIVSATLKDCTKALLVQGAEYNIIELNSSGHTDYALDLKNVTGAYGSGKGNWFRGILRNNGSDRCVNVGSGYSGSRFDLQIYDATGFGMVLNASNCTGTILIDGASTGIQINGSSNNLTIICRNCTTRDMSVAGDNNVLDVSCAGAVNVTGTGNTFRGKIDGAITKGTGNYYMGVAGFMGGGITTATTTALGEITITPTAHASATLSGFTPVVSDASNNYTCRVKSLSSGTFTVVVFDAAGVSVASTSVSIRWNFIGI